MNLMDKTENEYLDSYLKRKEEMLKLFTETIEFCLETGNENERKILEERKRELEEENFTIVVVGEFSAGKSTFLNSLMGERLLPALTKETTATVNFLRHTDKSVDGNNMRVIYTDGRPDTFMKEASFENIKEFSTTESQMVKVAETIDHVELFLESKFLENNVTLVDSPGLNGMAEGHKEITEAQIKKSHACIFLFSADQPGKKTDFETLEKIKLYTDKVFLILNKIDILNPDEETTVEDLVRGLEKNYTNLFPEEKLSNIYPVSALGALVARSSQELSYKGKKPISNEKEQILEDSNIKLFEERLWRFLTTGEKTLNFMKSNMKSLLEIVKNSKERFEKELIEIHEIRDTNELRDEIEKLHNEKENIEGELKSKEREIKKEIKKCTSGIRNSIEAKAAEIEMRIRKNIDEIAISMSEDTFDIELEMKNQCFSIKRRFERGMDEIIHDFMGECQTIVDENSLEIMASMDFPEFKLESEIVMEYKNHERNIEKENKEVENLKKKLEELKNEGNKLAEIEASNRLYKDREQQLREELQQLEQKRLTELKLMGSRPSVRYYEDNKNIQVRGTIGKFFLGEKYERLINRTEDKDDQINYDKNMKIITNEYREKIIKKENELRTYVSNGIYKVPNTSMEIITREMEDILKEIGDIQKRNERLGEFEQKKLIRNLKNKLEQFIDEIKEEAKNSIHKTIKGKGEEITIEITSLIGDELRNILERKNVILQEKILFLEGSQEKKKEIEDVLQNKIENSTALLKKIWDMNIKIEDITEDEIE